MDYTILNNEHQRAMWERALGNLEEQHYALEMECAFTIVAISGADKQTRAAGEAQIDEKRRIQASLARQITEAKAQLDALTTPTEHPSGPQVIAAAAD